MRSVLILLLVALPFVLCTVWEAETGKLVGVATKGKDKSDFTGTGYVTNFKNPNDGVLIKVRGVASINSLTLRYRSPFDNKKARIQFNGQPAGEVDLPKSAKWRKVSASQLLFKQGVNNLTVYSDWGYWDLDNVETKTVTPPKVPKVTSKPVDGQTTAGAKSLLRFLQKNFGNKTLAGQQDLANARWIKSKVGKSPAIVGFDFMDYSPSRVQRGAKSQAVEQAIQWDKEGGIVTFVWHWNAPTDLINKPGKEWWRGFYTDSTTFDVKKALAEGPKGSDYKLLIRDIDAIAVQLKRLSNAHVPVLFRPLHEAEGKWFWWGAKGPEACVQLYRILFNRIVHHHNIHNIIWVWNSVAAPWFVGNTFADVVSFDSYPKGADHSAQQSMFSALIKLGKSTKVVAMAECGPIPSPALLDTYNAVWSYFVTWGGFEKDVKSNSLAFVKSVYNDKGSHFGRN